MRKVLMFVPSHLGQCACYCGREVEQKSTSARERIRVAPSNARYLWAKRLGE